MKASEIIRYFARHKKPGRSKLFESRIVNTAVLRRFIDECEKCKDICTTEHLINDVSFSRGMSWGLVHPRNIQQYFPDDIEVIQTDQSMIDNERSIILRSMYRPTFLELHHIPYASGVIRFKPVKYGFFAVEVMLPPTFGAWPAVWLFGGDTEIDILEGYNRGHNTRYANKWGLPDFLLQSNYHLYHEDGVDTIGARSHPVPFDVTRNTLEVSCLWTDEEVTIFYNGYPVRRMKRSLVSQFNQPMELIINNAVMKTVPGCIYSEFLIKNVLIIY